MTSRGFARGRSATSFHRLALLTTVGFGLAGAAPHSAFATTFSYGGFSWFTDRADTATEATENGDFGRDDVLHLGINATTPPPNDAGFYQTEGYGTLTGLPVGSAFISGDLYIPSMANMSDANFYQSIGLWGVIGLAPTQTPENYPVIQFYNGPNPSVQPITPGSNPPSDVGQIRGADNGITDPTLSDWATLTGAGADPNFAVDPSAVINYGAWNTLRINYIAGTGIGGGSYQYVLNGTVIATTSGYPFEGVDPSNTSLYEIILNSRTNGENSYEVYWANIVASLDEQYYNTASLAPTAIIGGETILGTYTDRRGLDWDSNKYAWMHSVGGVAHFDDGAGQVDSTILGAQYGQDLFALGDSSTRAGLTFGYTNQSTKVTVPAGTTASSTGQEPSIGAYITHADDQSYADLLGQYRFLNFDATSPTSTGTVTGGSLDVAAETGVHWAMPNGVTVTPMGQFVYEHVTLNSATVGSGLNASFGDSDALIARARLLAQATTGGFSVFGSAGISDNVLGAVKTTISGNSFNTTIGGPQAEFIGGVEGSLRNGLSLFGSGEFDVSFDGQSKTYVGQAGFRQRF